MHPCRQGEAMSAYLDGLLSVEEAGRLREHIAACDSCGRQWEAMQWVVARFEAEPPVLAPAGFTGSVLSRIEKEQARRRLLLGTVGVLFSSLGYWVMAGAMLVAGWYLLGQPLTRLALFGAGSSAAWNIISACLSLARALWSVGALLAERVATPVGLCYGLAGFALTLLWARIVFPRWGEAPSRARMD